MQHFGKKRIRRAAFACTLVLLSCAAISYAGTQAVPTPAQKPVASKDAGFFNFSTLFNTVKKSEKPQTKIAVPVPAKKPAFVMQTSSGLKLEKTKPSMDPLDEDNERLYRQIFDLQAEGEIQKAKELEKKLTDNRLYGHVLYQRYMHPTAYTSSFRELKQWLNVYSDHPGAHNIYKLALRKGAGRAGELEKPETRINLNRRSEPTMAQSVMYMSSRSRSEEERETVKNLKRSIAFSYRKDKVTEALAFLRESEAAKLLDPVEYDIEQANIAAAFLYNGKVKKARDLAEKSAKRSGLHIPKAGWVAGLAAWIQEDYEAAARNFEIVGRSSYASGWTKSAGAYWAARARMRMGDVQAVATWLNRASAYPRTFYGLIATRALGNDFDFNWKVPTFTRDNYKIMTMTPAGYRAMSLIQAGQNEMAQQELIRMKMDDPTLREALLAFANYARLPGVAMRLGSHLSDDDNDMYYDAALYPMGPWQPDSGYTVDSALVHAIMRQESRFDPAAESHSGAKGLMQLMPGTAKMISRTKAGSLDDPETNIELGQQYLSTLLREKAVQDDLFRLLVAYNAGPGNLRRWSNRWPKVKDPLLFIELIPSPETRGYVERVLANYWIYRLRDRSATPTLDAVTAGRSAKYALRREAGIQTASAQ